MKKYKKSDFDVQHLHPLKSFFVLVKGILSPFLSGFTMQLMTKINLLVCKATSNIIFLSAKLTMGKILMKTMKKFYITCTV